MTHLLKKIQDNPPPQFSHKNEHLLKKLPFYWAPLSKHYIKFNNFHVDNANDARFPICGFITAATPSRPIKRFRLINDSARGASTYASLPRPLIGNETALTLNGTHTTLWDKDISNFFEGGGKV